MTPLDLARQTLMQLSKSQSPPTPENFRRVYDEISGVKSVDHSVMLSKTLDKVLHDMGKESPKYLAVAQKISTSVKKLDVESLESQLRSLLPTGASDMQGVNWATLLRYLLKQLDVNHSGITLSRKKEGLNRVIINFASDPIQLGQKIQALATSWGEGHEVTLSADNIPDETTLPEISLVPDDAQSTSEGKLQTQQAVTDDCQLKLAISWRDLLIRTITLVVLPQFADIPAASGRIEALIKRAQASNTAEEVNALSEALKSTLLRAEMQTDSQHRMQDSLVQMLRLLVSSMGELTVEDKWLHGQIAIVQDIISKPLNLDTVYNAESSLKELIFKQSNIKPGLLAAKETLKGMMSTFVSGLADITESTGTYQVKISDYQEQISATEDIAQLNAILQSLVGDIHTMNAEAQHSQAAFLETQKKVEEAEKQINELTTKLDYISEVAHEDFLTGALNRRGMDDAIEREFSRADRHNSPLSLAMIDIDHFKKINDTMGHSTGDVALAHLAKVVKSVLRSTDVLARYGGEEFVILLPGSKQADAVNVIIGVQRDLTKNFFMHNSERVLITFSAGVSERLTGESIDAVLPRADAALYLAKQTGRNRVVGAPPP
ncbi:GGDEF domain-containing protein [Methylotenera sp.]|uniref:GGDEF domain-containing protein n=1 Tax=Methylotenera sp. TaxID=2051956 RepID=UPI00272FFE44|nr:GGDEF domain-containing protein [Methylotenera sp.]MDP2230574.1 GGDEF domain-containing protein [Methylotenera sp.]MDP3142096.1 GGDEF domain-containing protein [Methylotenera sp.]